MGWGIDFKIDIFLSKQDYGENIYQVKDAIYEIERQNEDIKTKLNMFASANPRDIIPTEWSEEPIRWLNNNVDELLSDLNENAINRHKLELYLQYLEEGKETDEM